MLGFAGGVLLRSFLFIQPEVLLLLLVVALGLAVVWFRAKGEHSPGALPSEQIQNILLYTVIGLTAVALGAFRFGWAEQVLQQTSLTDSVGETVTLVGKVVSEPDVRAASTLLTVVTEDTKVLVRVDRYAAVDYGDTIAVTGKLAEPESFLTDLGREFDYAGYLQARGITHTMSFVTPEVVDDNSTTPLAYVYRAKEYFLTRLALVITEPAVALGSGLLLGVQSALGEELEAAFRTTGIIHIVVLSGYNIMLVVAFVMYVFAYLLPFRTRLLCGIGAVVLFALLVGYSPSVMRASLMAILFLLSALLARPYLILRMLILAGVLMIMWNPYIMRYDIGFQLSFMATLGLILVAPHLEIAFTRVSAWFSIRSFLVATIATQIAVAPLLLYHIGEWSVVAVPVNVLVLPMVPVAMLLTFLAGLIALVSVTAAIPFGFLAEVSLLYIIKVAEIAATIPFASVAVPPFPGIFVPLLYVLLGLLWYRYIYERQALPKVTSSQYSQVESVAGWTIVAESDEKPRQLVMLTKPKAGETTVSLTPDCSDDRTAIVPIFFR